ncbi:Kif5c, partial [Symbiodinium sp. KB8]
MATPGSGAAASDTADSPVKVFARFRPLNSAERERGDDPCVTYDGNGKSVRVRARGKPGKDFHFDGVLQPGSSQAATYSACAAWLVSGLFEGFNATCLAYGQTGSGKTFTMEGPEREVLAADASLVGVIPRMVTDLFANIDSAQEEEEFTVKVSFVEIYME